MRGGGGGGGGALDSFLNMMCYLMNTFEIEGLHIVYDYGYT
jgi:hypothetical protein